MPPRHLIVIALAAIICLSCYQISSRNRLATVFAYASDLIVNQSLYPVDREQLMHSAMDGMMENLDVNSHFLVGAAAEQRMEFLNQSYAGLGIHIRRDPTNQSIVIVMPLHGSPAREVGLMPGDQIIGIAGLPVDQLDSMEEVRNLLKGPEGTQVDLEVQRWQSDSQQWKPFQVSVQRRIIPTYNVVGDRPDGNGSWHFTMESAPQIGYIRIKQFGGRTAEELQQALEKIDGQVAGLILDLRENRGGLLEAAVKVSDMFLDQPERVIVSIRDREGQERQTFYSTDERPLRSRFPIVVLVNYGSASASEIVAACLQDHGMATVVGQRTYGKGTVQTQFALPQARTFLNLTTASYWRPNGENIHRMRWRSREKRAEAERLADGNLSWGVQPRAPQDHIPLNARDRRVLEMMYDNRQLGLPLDDVDDSLKQALDRLGTQIDDELENGLSGEPTSELPSQIFWDDPQPLDQRDPQMRRALQQLLPGAV